MGQADHSPCRWSSPAEQKRDLVQQKWKEMSVTKMNDRENRGEKKFLIWGVLISECTDKNSRWETLCSKTPGALCSQGSRCSEGAACSTSEDSKELGRKCALRFAGVRHEAEIAQHIHYARHKLGFRCSDVQDTRQTRLIFTETLHNLKCSKGKVQPFLALK